MSDKPQRKSALPTPRFGMSPPPDMRTRVLRKIGSMTVLVGAALLAAAYFAWQKQNETRAEHVDAVVVTEGQPPANWPTVQFTAPAGNIVRITGSAGTRTLAKGDHISVLYDPLHPERARIDDSGSSMQQVFLIAGIGAAFVIFGLVYAVTLRRLQRTP